ncbi:MAG: hypothetical protein ABFC78_05870 [Methanoregula sp.]
MREERSHCDGFTCAGIKDHPGEFLVFPEDRIPYLYAGFIIRTINSQSVDEKPVSCSYRCLALRGTGLSHKRKIFAGGCVEILSGQIRMFTLHPHRYSHV